MVKAYHTTFGINVKRILPYIVAALLTAAQGKRYNGNILQKKGRSAMLQCKNVGLTYPGPKGTADVLRRVNLTLPSFGLEIGRAHI